MYLIKVEYPIAKTNGPSSNKEMMREKENVVRYVAGNVCRRLSLTTTSYKLIVSCLFDAKSDNEQEDDVSEELGECDQLGGTVACY